MRRWWRPSVWATVAVLALLPLVLVNSYLVDVAIRIGLAAIAAIGLNLVMGFAGQISIGHAAFVALGAYGSAIACARFGWPPPVALLASAAGAALLAWIMGKPILRLRGHSLTMVTLGFGIVVQIVLVNEVAWTGGPDGMPVAPMQVGALVLGDVLQWYAVVAVLLLIAVVLSLNLHDSPAGRALRGLHGSEVAARVMGVDVGAFKVRAFVASAVFAAVSGSLTAHYLGFLSPAMSNFTESVALAPRVVGGGLGSTFGAVLGAGLMTLLPQVLGGLQQYEMVLFGLILMLTMIFRPRGLVPAVEALRRPRRA